MGGRDEPTADAPELPPLDLGPDALDPDPQPAAETRSRRAGKQPEAPKPAAKQPRAGGKFVSSKAQVKDLADELDSYAKMLALTWSLSDEHCAGVLNETSAAICADIAALAGRSEWVMEKFRTTSLLGDCFKLLHHLWPLLRAINAHHGTGRMPEQEDHEHEPVTVVDPGQYGPWRPQVA
jgi:hypothetical protein